jgi:hypothetical protein
VLLSHKNEERTLAKTAAPNKRTNTAVLRLKVTLRGARPPIWRRILMPGSTTLSDLHLAIQVTMGWHDGHLHDFDVGGEHYGDPSTMDDVADERRVTLNALVKSGVSRFSYTYDFGDTWEHQVLIEKAAPSDKTKPHPTCIAGKRNCPPEDCGGVWGYTDLLEILANPAHPEHEERLEWLGGEFDPEAFSVADTDAALAAAFGRKERART